MSPFTDSDFKECFKMPTLDTLSLRTSTITSAFVKSIIPVIKPTVGEIREVLKILVLEPEPLLCAYCGEPAKTWDHFQPCVRDGRPTGYLHEIWNLVPACSACNSSKQGTDWRPWIESRREGSPRARRIDVTERIQRLTAFEQLGALQPVDFSQAVGEKEWKEYWAERDAMLAKMRALHRKSQKIARLVKVAHDQAQAAAEMGQEYADEHP